MSDAPKGAFPAYDALTRGLGTLSKAQALHKERAPEPEPKLPDFDEESGVVHVASLHPHSVPVSEAPRDQGPVSRVYQRLHEELSHLVSEEAATAVLDAALRDIGVARADASTLDFREALVEHIPERLARYAAADQVEAMEWALERALMDIHRARSG